MTQLDRQQIDQLERQKRQLRDALQAVDDWLNTKGTLKLFEIEKLVADTLAQTKGGTS